MEQLLWILGFIPNFIWFALLVLSLLVLVLQKLLDKLLLHNLYARTISITILIVSAWFIGFNYNENKHQEEVKQTKQQIELLEQKNLELNTTLENKHQEKTQDIKQKTKTIVQFIEKEVFVDKEVVQYVQNCPKLPNIIIDTHNKAVELENKK